MPASQVLEIRKSLKLTQEQAAARVGITRRTWQDYERGVKPVSRPLAILIRLLGEGKV